MNVRQSTACMTTARHSSWHYDPPGSIMKGRNYFFAIKLMSMRFTKKKLLPQRHTENTKRLLKWTRILPIAICISLFAVT